MKLNPRLIPTVILGFSLSFCSTAYTTPIDDTNRESIVTMLKNMNNPFTETKAISANINVRFSSSAIGYELNGVFNGTNITEENYQFNLVLNDGGNQVANMVGENETWTCSYSNYSILGNTIFKESTQTINFNSSTMRSILTNDNINFYDLLGLDEANQLEGKVDTTKNMYFISVTNENISAFVNGFVGLNIDPSAYLSSSYAGPIVSNDTFKGLVLESMINLNGTSYDLDVKINFNN